MPNLRQGAQPVHEPFALLEGDAGIKGRGQQGKGRRAMTHPLAHRPSYNAKVMCDCGRAEKSKAAPACRECGKEKYKAARAATREASKPEKVTKEALVAAMDIDMANEWLRKSIRVAA